MLRYCMSVNNFNIALPIRPFPKLLLIDLGGKRIEFLTTSAAPYNHSSRRLIDPLPDRYNPLTFIVKMFFGT
ncbi:hypothetical protein MKW98_003999 [Papaver atlanticum]|uniref:Uncharacterized protein n=1 Tax=Papaver atlanticum TaxID=357466 RepID=A0AAD4XPR4_9MAGN|nr:hypothetical protein MKW98_003999 [Papaver atlanticum]